MHWQHFFCNDVDCFGSMCVIIFFSCCTFSVLFFLVLFLVDYVSVINSNWADFIFALTLEILLCDVELFFFDRWFNFFFSMYLFLQKISVIWIVWFVKKWFANIFGWVWCSYDVASWKHLPTRKIFTLSLNPFFP